MFEPRIKTSMAGVYKARGRVETNEVGQAGRTGLFIRGFLDHVKFTFILKAMESL